MSAQSKAKDAATAAMMKKSPGRYPDSVMRPCPGLGAKEREAACRIGGRVPSSGRHYMIGMLGGVIADRLGYPSKNMPLAL